MAKRKIGLMGGTFDPVHNAHLALAQQAYRQFSLDEVWMLPNGNPLKSRCEYAAGHAQAGSEGIILCKGM